MKRTDSETRYKKKNAHTHTHTSKKLNHPFSFFDCCFFFASQPVDRPVVAENKVTTATGYSSSSSETITTTTSTTGCAVSDTSVMTSDNLKESIYIHMWTKKKKKKSDFLIPRSQFQIASL